MNPKNRTSRNFRLDKYFWVHNGYIGFSDYVVLYRAEYSGKLSDGLYSINKSKFKPIPEGLTDFISKLDIDYTDVILMPDIRFKRYHKVYGEITITLSRAGILIKGGKAETSDYMITGDIPKYVNLEYLTEIQAMTDFHSINYRNGDLMLNFEGVKIEAFLATINFDDIHLVDLH